MRATMGKENVAMFFIFIFFWRNHVVLKVKWRRPVGPDCWTGLGMSRPGGTRLDERSCASIIFFLAKKMVKRILFSE
jgi:hypothetical protein